MGKILNFDNFMAEKKKETISVTVMGKEYVVPMEIPARYPRSSLRIVTTVAAQRELSLIASSR